MTARIRARTTTTLRPLGRAIERIVGSDVHDGEWRLVVLFFANLFLLLTAYYILKVIREPLILLGGGAVSRSYARGLQAAVLAIAIPVYGLLANRVEPDRLVKWVLTFFVACLVTFHALGRIGLPLGFAFFVWLGIFSTLSIAQFWSLAVDLLSEQEGRRLFPLVAAGGTLGGIMGAQLAAHAIAWLDPHQLMLVAATMLAGCIVLTHRAHLVGVERQRVRRVTDQAPTASPRDARGGFGLVLHDRYLLLLGLSVLLLNLINTNGDFILAEMVHAKASTLAAGVERQRFIGSFYGDFQTYVSTLTAVVQIMVVGRVFKTIGVGRALYFLPAFALTGYGASALVPGLALIATVKVIENSTDYSLQNTIQQALFLPTSRDAKYKAKAAIDTVSVRLGDLGSTALVFAGAELGLGALGFAAANVVAALVWLALVSRLARRHRAFATVSATALPVAAARPSAVDRGGVELLA